MSDKRLAEEALKETEQRFRFLFQGSINPVIIVDRNLVYLHANVAANKYLGFIKGTIEGKTVQEAMKNVPEFRDLWVKRLKEYFKTGKPETAEDMVIINGKNVWSESSLSSIKDSKGKIIAVGIIYRDTTDKRSTEEKIRESEEKYRSIVENTEDMIMLTKPDATIDYLSPACNKVIGYNPEDLIGKKVSLKHPIDKERVEKALSSALKGEKGHLDYRVLTKTGDTKWVSHTWNPIISDGKLKIIVSVVRDITEQRKNENEIEKSKKELEEKIFELEKFNKISVGREIKMVELKKRLKELEGKKGG